MSGAKFQTSEPTLHGTKCQQTKKETVQNLSGIHCWMMKTLSKEENKQKRNPSFAAEKQRIGNPSNSALHQDDDDTTPNQSTRGYPITKN